MNDMTVGMENLPNVFIDKITVERVTDEAFFRIQVILKMFDYAEDHSWYNKVAGLKVKCGLIQDDEIIAGLNDGTLSLYDVNIDFEKPDKIGIKSCDSFYSVGPSDGYKDFRTIFEFKLTTFPTNLNVYAACFIDDLEFGIPQFDKFYGPMAAEKIYVGGVPNEESGYFYNPETNEEYGGPVHQHSSGYMEGSEHSDEPHAGLRYVSEENYKMIIGEGVEINPVLEEEYEDQPSPFDSTAPYDSSAPSQATSPPSGFSSAAEYEAYLLSQTAQQPNFNVVGNPTTINNPTGY